MERFSESQLDLRLGHACRRGDHFGLRSSTVRFGDAGRGHYPIKFNGSIFTVDGVYQGVNHGPDFRLWGGGYWFQNTRLVYWPMLASGDFDLMRPLFRMYEDAMPLARIRSRAYFDHEGCYFPETYDLLWNLRQWRFRLDAAGRPASPGDPSPN